MIVFPNKQSREYLEEVTAFAKKYNLWVAMPETAAEINKLTPRDRDNRHNNLNTRLEYLDTYSEHWSTRKTTVESHDGRSGEEKTETDERRWQTTFTRCLLFKDSCSSFMGFEFILEGWDREISQYPSKDEYKLGTYLSPEEVKEIVEKLSPEAHEGIATQIEWRNLDYWLKYGCKWEELPGNFFRMNHWTRMINGGLIFNGPGYPCDGSFPQLTVSLVNDRTPGWGIHT